MSFEHTQTHTLAPDCVCSSESLVVHSSPAQLHCYCDFAQSLSSRKYFKSLKNPRCPSVETDPGMPAWPSPPVRRVVAGDLHLIMHQHQQPHGVSRPSSSAGWSRTTCKEFPLILHSRRIPDQVQHNSKVLTMREN